MSETVSAFNPTTGLFSDTLLNATDLNTAFTVKLAGLGGGSGGSGYTLPTASTVTLGGVKIDGATILVGTGMAAGVISVGSVPYSNITGAPAIGALAALPVPAAGIVLSTGTALTPLTIGANLTLTGSTLAGTGGGGGASFPGGSGLSSATGTAVAIGSGLALSGGTLSVSYAYTLPAATTGALGGVKVGSGLSVAGDGTLSATGTTLTVPNSSLIGGNGTALTSVTVGSGLAFGSGTLTGALTSVVGQTGAVTATQIAAALPVAAVGTKGILSVDGTSIAVNGSGVASVVGTAPTAAGSVPAASALQLVSTSDTYFTGTQLQTIFDAAGTSAAETTRAQAAEALAAQKANNLSDLASAATARTNLGLGALATQAVPAAGIVLSTGTALGPLTIGANLTLTGSTLAVTSGGGFTAVPFATGSSPVTSGSTQALAWSTTSTSAIYEYVLGANTTFSLGTPPTGVDARIELRVKNDAAGTYTATAPTPSGGWAGTTAPAPVTGANAIAVYKFAASSFGVLGSY